MLTAVWVEFYAECSPVIQGGMQWYVLTSLDRGLFSVNMLNRGFLAGLASHSLQVPSLRQED
jgi:hypothetical protein